LKYYLQFRTRSRDLIAAMALGLLAPPSATWAAVPAPPPMETYTYKTVGPLAIKADVYRPAQATDRSPVLVYLHGGSLINGGRGSLAKHPFRQWFPAAGFVVVSIDYRLAPETKLAGIVEDLEDAVRWVRRDGPRLFGADPDRIAVAGGSAGGYLTLVAGYRAKPRPFALVAEMSYGDLIGPWQMRPSIHPPHYQTHLTAEEAWSQVSGPPIANARNRRGNGSAFNDFLRRNALWPKAVSGWDPVTEADKYLPYLPLRNVTPDYPPTFFIHGHDDTDVPREQPEMMAAELQRNGVEHRLILLPHGEHGYRGADPRPVEDARHQAFEFVLRHLPAPVPPSRQPPAAATANRPSP
jgi:acetyl esterase/lipase